MDDLSFRRTIYADPSCTDEDVIQAALDDPKKQAFWNDIKQMDADLAMACKVEVPEDLANKLILQQSLTHHQHNKKRTRIHLALAASIVFTFGLSFTLWQGQHTIHLGEHALAHVYHEGDGYALKANGDVSIDRVNAQLASIGAEFKQSMGRIFFANFCNFDNIRSYHMVMQDTDGSKITVFVVPQSDNQKIERYFSDDNMTGQMFEANNARIIVIGGKDKSLEEMEYKLKQNMLFSA